MALFFGALMSPEIKKNLWINFFFQKNSWRVIYYLAQLFTRGFDFVRRYGEVMMSQNLVLWHHDFWFCGIATSPHRRTKSNPRVKKLREVVKNTPTIFFEKN